MSSLISPTLSSLTVNMKIPDPKKNDSLNRGERRRSHWSSMGLNSQLHIRRTFNHGKFMEPESKVSRQKIRFCHEFVAKKE